ncbi:MAG: 50S ribosomal protein L19 [Lachnospiraceae bacterium]|nr:50S ribosomal protein L19 [Lachnospiraceae bacterium]MBQ6259561.1 50S ribosomal protein L19 [Lachnospiraceae bacterium]
MNANEVISAIEEEQKRETPLDIAVGDTVKVSAKIREGEKERIQVFEGVVLKIQGTGARKTFTVRKFSNGVGVEKTWPVNSPNVAKVEVVRHGKIRRARLNYLRDRIGKRAKVKEKI